MWWRIQKLLMMRPRQLRASNEMVVVISGCDSGIGLRTAVAASGAGFTVVAGLLGGPNGEGAVALKELCPPNRQPHLLHLDITNQESVSNVGKYVKSIINDNPNYFLHAVVNNAGVMVFGNLEWQTERQIEMQVNVNVLGTWRLSREMLPLLRQSSLKNKSNRISPRLITVGSHCGIQPLPLLSVYGATKCALRGWMEALRMELRPAGVDVVNFIPGSFPTTTNIAVNQKKHTVEMKESFSSEGWSRHQEEFDRLLTNYLDVLSFPKPVDSVKDDVLMEKMLAAMLDVTPDLEYKHQPWRYAFYHFLCGLTGARIRYWLVDRFLSYPEFGSKRKLKQ